MQERKYMTLKDVTLSQPLASVRRAENGTDALVMPEEFLNTVIGFFLAAGMEYEAVKDTSEYPEDEIKSGLRRYSEIISSDDYDSYAGVILISEFDSECLFEWMKQIYGSHRDPSFEQYLEDRAAYAKECYLTHDAGVPQIYASTFFDSKEEMDQWINEALLDPNNMQRMVKWSIDDGAEDSIDIEYTAWEPGRNTGKGIYVDPQTREIAAYICKSVNVRLAKDDDMPDGFCLITAFPQIDEQSVPAGRDITEDLHRSKAYQNADPEQKLIYDALCSPDHRNDH